MRPQFQTQLDNYDLVLQSWLHLLYLLLRLATYEYDGDDDDNAEDDDDDDDRGSTSSTSSSDLPHKMTLIDADADADDKCNNDDNDFCRDFQQRSEIFVLVKHFKRLSPRAQNGDRFYHIIIIV